MLADILITILLIASTFYLTIVLLRFLLQLEKEKAKIRRKVGGIKKGGRK